MKKIFIDGKEGTTGLRIYERLGERTDIEILTLPECDRKDPVCRKKMLNAADIVFLCLPDAAAIEAVEMIENESTVVLDTSTAHRTADGWIYGFPEISSELDASIASAKRIAVPGCHASGFLALIKPLIDADILDKNVKLCCHSLTGYSGGGKKMIAQYESEERPSLLDAPRQYALSQNHKHLREMKAIAGLEYDPIFCPIVADYYSGMEVTVPLFASDLKSGRSVSDIKKLYKSIYNSSIVHYAEEKDDGDKMLSSNAFALKDDMEISVFGNGERILLTARYDNLGKGASGAAVECLNMVLGADKAKGLNV